MILAPLSLKAAGFVVLAAVAPPIPICPNVKAPEIRVETFISEPEIDHSQSLAQMRTAKSDTTEPYQMKQLDHAGRGGMIQSDIKIDYKVNTSLVPGNTAETVNMNCVKYDKIRIKLSLKPKIFIASDYDEKSCWYQETLRHEMSHIDMDRVVIEKYKGRLQDGMALAFSGPQDTVQGPVTKVGVTPLRKTMGNQLVNMTNMLLSDMARERAEQQQAVDSLQNYAYIMNQCYHGDNVVRVQP